MLYLIKYFFLQKCRKVEGVIMSKQISAYISSETQASMEHYSVTYGVKKGFLIENALDHYLQALYAIPEEFIIPTKLVLSLESFQMVTDMMENPPEPTQELKELMQRND
jgi:uncharacterized protein (DUF1778 family)